jgi:UDP-N-acetylglucosamine--N-acetylmuramyl-(pentapeptide) pyrophosphoryl-undecaprenol N-acetylglucosamine transferase
MDIVITGGGTGGHLAIAKSLAQELNLRGIKPIYIGSTNGQDRDWFKNCELFKNVYFMPTRGVVNQNFFGKIISLTKIIISVIKSIIILKKNRVTKVISVGGYSAAPASFASIILKIDFFIHEQNSVTGKLNALLKKYTKRFFSSYEEPFDDYPVRELFFDNSRIRQKIETIIFLGGSQGAKAINDLSLNIAKKLKDKNIKIIHQTGKQEFDRVNSAYKELGVEADVFAFSDSIYEKIKEADFAICRSGASTIWELCASNLPAIYIPYPYAASNHQYYNAKFLSDKNASYLVEQKELKYDDIMDIIEQKEIKNMSKKLKGLINKNGTKQIIQEILS